MLLGDGLAEWRKLEFERFKAVAASVKAGRLRELAAHQQIRLEMMLLSDRKVRNRFSVLLHGNCMDDTEGTAFGIQIGRLAESRSRCPYVIIGRTHAV